MKMTVLYISHEKSKSSMLGSTLSLSNLIDSVKNKCDIIVLTPNKGKSYYYFKEQGYRCISLPFPKGTISNKNIFRNIIVFLPKLFVYLILNIYCLLCLKIFFLNKRIDIIHTNSSVIDFGFYLSKVLRAKHIWHLREFQNLDFNLRPFLGWKYLRTLIKKSAYSIAITEPIARHFKIYGLKNNLVLGDAVRKITDTYMVWPKEKYFLFCGHICKAKGAEIAINAFSLFMKNPQYSDFRLVFLGEVDNKYKDFLLQIDSKLKDNIDFLGFKKDVSSYFKKASAFLMCSEYEGLGRVTIEAMFYGCPVIGRNTGGTSVLLKNNENGLLFDDFNECYMNMKKICNNISLAKEKVRNAQYFVKENFSEEKYGKKILTIYHQVLKI